MSRGGGLETGGDQVQEERGVHRHLGEREPAHVQHRHHPLLLGVREGDDENAVVWDAGVQVRSERQADHGQGRAGDRHQGGQEDSGSGGETLLSVIMPLPQIDDCSFHRCVRLGQFDAERTITFVPPDGEFQLMDYRVSDNITLPFRVNTALQEEGRSKLSITVRVATTFSAKTYATNVVIRIPVEPNRKMDRWMIEKRCN